MRTLFKYPNTTTELHQLVNLINLELDKINSIQSKKDKSRSWSNLCHTVNYILKQTQEQNKSIFFMSQIHHNKVANIITEWMKNNKFPIR